MYFRQEPCNFFFFSFRRLAVLVHDTASSWRSETLFPPLIRLWSSQCLLHLDCAGEETTGLPLMSQAP